MGVNKRKQLVYTVKDKCRVCYTCVRECPVKAIKIMNGQAEVINERCIGCGNCTRVCSQGAKVFLKTINEVYDTLCNNKNVVACLAPSFPAEFTDISNFRVLAGMIKNLGFPYVVEVAFGADMVAREYRKILLDNTHSTISSDCPAVVYFVQHYFPELVSSLAPIVSPMVAMARIARKKYGNDAKVIFIGPCIAKKAESDEINESITFTELRKMFKDKNITPENVEPADFDPPYAGKGSVFPVNRGLLQTAGVSEDITEGNIIVARGNTDFREAIKEFESGLIESQHLELLCCEGCIMGPGMTPDGKRFPRTKLISNYVRTKIKAFDKDQWDKDVDEFSDVNFSQHFEVLDRRLPSPTARDVEKVLQSMGKYRPSDHLNCGACGYPTCEEHAIAIVLGLAETEMCLPYTIEKLHKSINDLNLSKEKLETTRQALKQSERLATMGQLSAGIAHELNNPLGIITMYSNILKDESSPEDPVRKDLDLIIEQADRCKRIVGGLLNFARKNQVNYSEVNIIQFAKHSIASVMVPANIKVVIEHKISNPLVMLDSDQMMQVLSNVEKNAVEAMPEGGTITVSLCEEGDDIVLNIIDTGVGISDENMEKIFTPFFTTKGVGKGTGLGLPIIYGIVKMHKGKIDVTSNAEPEKGPTGTTFMITIPRKNEN